MARCVLVDPEDKTRCSMFEAMLGERTLVVFCDAACCRCDVPANGRKRQPLAVRVLKAQPPGQIVLNLGDRKCRELHTAGLVCDLRNLLTCEVLQAPQQHGTRSRVVLRRPDGLRRRTLKDANGGRMTGQATSLPARGNEQWWISS